MTKWRILEFSRNLFQCFFFEVQTETAKTVQRQLHILHNISKFRHFVISSHLFYWHANHIKEKQKIHENIEIEEIVENNEFVTSSPSINSELEHPNEIFCSKRDKDLQPIVQVRKLTKAEIELFEGGKSLQPHVLFTKLKDIDLPQNSRKKVLDYILPVKKGKKANPKLH